MSILKTKKSFLITFLAFIISVNSKNLDNAFDLTIEESDQEFGKIETDDLIDLSSIQTEDWKGAPKFLNFCQKNQINETKQIHR